MFRVAGSSQMDFVTSHGGARCEEGALRTSHQLGLPELGHGIEQAEAVDLAIAALDSIRVDDATPQHLQTAADPHQLSARVVVLEHALVEATLAQPAQVGSNIFGAR